MQLPAPPPPRAPAPRPPPRPRPPAPPAHATPPSPPRRHRGPAAGLHGAGKKPGRVGARAHVRHVVRCPAPAVLLPLQSLHADAPAPSPSWRPPAAPVRRTYAHVAGHAHGVMQVALHLVQHVLAGAAQHDGAGLGGLHGESTPGRRREQVGVVSHRRRGKPGATSPIAPPHTCMPCRRAFHSTPPRPPLPPPAAHLAVHDEGVELVADLAHLKQPRPRADVALPDLVCGRWGRGGVVLGAREAWLVRQRRQQAGRGQALEVWAAPRQPPTRLPTPAPPRAPGAPALLTMVAPQARAMRLLSVLRRRRMAEMPAFMR